MTDQPYRATGGRMAAGVVLALALGVATPVLTVAELLTLTPVMQLSGVFMVFLFAFAGRLPAWLYMTVQLAASARLMGSTYMWMTMAAGTFPAILCMRGLMLKKPFFEQVRTGILFYLLGLVGAIMIATGTFGGNLIGQLSDSMIAQFRAMPDAFFAPFVETVNQRLEESGLSGLAPLMAPMTVATYRSQFIAVAELLGQTYQQALPGALIAGAAVSGVVGALWSNWQMARRGFATDYSYIEPTRWFLPRSVTAGLMLIWVVGYFISESKYASGEAVYMAAYMLASAAFIIQGMCAVDRFFYRRGASDSRRRHILYAAAIFGPLLRLLNPFLFIVGAGSALFGSQGALRRPAPMDDDDDNE